MDAPGAISWLYEAQSHEAVVRLASGGFGGGNDQLTFVPLYVVRRFSRVCGTRSAVVVSRPRVSASLVPIYLRKPCHGSAQPVPATGNPSPRILRLRDMNILNQLTTGRAYYV